ncbi:uncharacterized protein LOC103950650 [Pyrus x bretschneideri]|uniref:uncharacterized protein LOC103950650 n=1 Tax=Pyrus x bretschneideri TaxID=225117 RepID=UPI000510B25D|nr:uncharacterized protein LOC103950650 [Pyrus x bretschneideri]
MMSRCGYEQSAMVGCEGMDSVVCPKPRRLSFLTPSFNDNVRPFRYFNHNQSEIGDSEAGSEILDIILAKGNCDDRFSTNQLASSPPFFCGSPPSRASNPVIQDEHFGNSSNMAPFLPTQPMLSSRNGGCVRMKSGDKPVAVRIEGFDCLSRDRRNCSISAIA